MSLNAFQPRDIKVGHNYIDDFQNYGRVYFKFFCDSFQLSQE